MLKTLPKKRRNSTAELADGELLKRFRARRDEAAFRTLVQRHGAMVLAVCQRVLYDRHAAEDAYQATFLVLARKAGSIGRPELLANWLHGVAYRVAYKIKSQAARRREVEAQAQAGGSAEPSLQAAWREVQAVLDEELHQLPEKHRLPLILVYLEGKTHEEAAALLDCPTGSMSWRLDQARQQLRRRLRRRGLALSIALLMYLFWPAAAPASETLINATVVRAMFPTAEIVPVTQSAAVTGSLRTLVVWIAALAFLGGSSALAYHSWNVTFGDGGNSAASKMPGCTKCTQIPSS